MGMGKERRGSCKRYFFFLDGGALRMWRGLGHGLRLMMDDGWGWEKPMFKMQRDGLCHYAIVDCASSAMPQD